MVVCDAGRVKKNIQRKRVDTRHVICLLSCAASFSLTSYQGSVPVSLFMHPRPGEAYRDRQLSPNF